MGFQAAESLSEQIARHIAEQIITGELVEGERIQELRIARDLDVSRGSVREALLILERSYLIEIFPRRGAIVAEMSVQQIKSLFDVSMLILGNMVQRTSECWRQTDGELMNQLMVRLADQVRAGDIEQFYDQVFVFLQQTHKMIGNAYLADMFGTQFVGAIHGRLLTAWSTAGILGPVVVNYMHDTRLEAGVPFDKIYAPIFLVLAGMLVVGFIANLLVKPVADKYFMTDAELAEVHKQAHEKSIQNGASAVVTRGSAEHPILVKLAWAAVLIPISYGIWMTVQKAWALFS